MGEKHSKAENKDVVYCQGKDDNEIVKYLDSFDQMEIEFDGSVTHDPNILQRVFKFGVYLRQISLQKVGKSKKKRKKLFRALYENPSMKWKWWQIIGHPIRYCSRIEREFHLCKTELVESDVKNLQRVFIKWEMRSVTFENCDLTNVKLNEILTCREFGRVDLSGSKMEESSSTALKHFISMNRQLKHLILRNCNLTESQTDQILSGFKNKNEKIEILVLSGNRINVSGSVKMALLMRGKQVANLVLRNCEIPEEGLGYLLKYVENVQQLDIRGNTVTSDLHNTYQKELSRRRVLYGPDLDVRSRSSSVSSDGSSESDALIPEQEPTEQNNKNAKEFSLPVSRSQDPVTFEQYIYINQHNNNSKDTRTTAKNIVRENATLHAEEMNSSTHFGRI